MKIPHTQTRTRFTAIPLCAAAALAMLLALSASAHETDQYTLPHGREFADLGPYMTQWAYKRIESGVQRTNDKIEQCIRAKRGQAALEKLQHPDEIVSAVNSAFPNAYDVIEGYESLTRSKSMQRQFPGKVIGYKKQFTNVFEKAHFILDPRQFFRIWHASTVKAFGVYFGTDKIGHFTDMGMHYYRAYSDAIHKGRPQEQAFAEAVRVGTHGPIFSERGMVGYLSAGAYSNADLVANYVGLLFYKNLTDPVMLKSELRPPMLVRDGEYWKIAPHVRPDSDFFSWFVSDHWNEVFNPSHFEPGMRSAVRKAVRARTDIILERYADQLGNRHTQGHFEVISERMRTYYGQDYGHKGPRDELITVANTCFDTFSLDAPAHLCDGCGNTPLHDAAATGDLQAIHDLIERGADVNARVLSDELFSSDWGNTPLHHAAREGYVKAAEVLIDHGASVNARNHKGAAPLHYAVDFPDVALLLIRRGASVDVRDDRGLTPLHWAAWKGDASAAKRLVEQGADPNAADHAGETPLHRAARTGAAEVATALIAARANVNASSKSGLTPLHLAAVAGDALTIDLLLVSGAHANAVDEFGCTPMHDAARNQHDQIMQLLAAHGARNDKPDLNGHTPSQLAIRHGNPEKQAADGTAQNH